MGFATSQGLIQLDRLGHSWPGSQEGTEAAQKTITIDSYSVLQSVIIGDIWWLVIGDDLWLLIFDDYELYMIIWGHYSA